MLPLKTQKSVVIHITNPYGKEYSHYYHTQVFEQVAAIDEQHIE